MISSKPRLCMRRAMPNLHFHPSSLSLSLLVRAFIFTLGFLLVACGPKYTVVPSDDDGDPSGAGGSGGNGGTGGVAAVAGAGSSAGGTAGQAAGTGGNSTGGAGLSSGGMSAAAGTGGSGGAGSAAVGGSSGADSGGTGGGSSGFGGATFGCDVQEALTKSCGRTGCHSTAVHYAGLDLTDMNYIAEQMVGVPATHGDKDCAPPGEAFRECAGDELLAICPVGVLRIDPNEFERSWVYSKLMGLQGTCGSQMPAAPGSSTSNGWSTERRDCLLSFFRWLAAGSP
jgi:hypothetical protein